jgi:signal transduction histidine kinase
MIVDRLRVRGKLNFLLAVPLVAVVLVAVPFVAVQIEATRSAATTADAARNARQLGGLVWELQRERLLTAGYLASPTDDGVALQLQQQTVADSVEAIRRSLGDDASDELVEALARVQSLGDLRQGALARGVSLESVARTYHAVIGAVVDALRLASQRTSDAEGTRQLTALDALLRANEENALRGMALIAAATKPQTGLRILEDASAQAQMFTERFVQQSDVNQARLVVLVDQGEAARQVEGMVDALDDSPTARPNLALVPDALAGVEAQSTLRRLVQDRVTREIADAAAGRATDARSAAWTVGLGTAFLFLLVMALAMFVSRSISRPLQRLTLAATAVADVARTELLRVSDVEHADEQPPRVAAIDVKSGDEVGELATAFNRVQTTAAMLLERQLVTRRNVSLIFANVAQRTQNLVGRQLVVIDELERDEQNTQLLSKLYRLDHLSTRLRRNAKNLLVVAGAREQTNLGAPMGLTTALRAALAEIEDYQRVRIGPVPDATLAPQLGSDLVLVLAELVENATAFSPPGSSVEVRATVGGDGGGCVVTVVDHGIGMTSKRLAEENDRIVERERLDIAPTSVLGLFVVGRLSRRHGLTVELSETPGGGVTATVRIPTSLVTVAPVRSGTIRPMSGSEPIGRRQPLIPTPALVIPEATSDGPFSWFAGPGCGAPALPAAAPVLEVPAVRMAALPSSAPPPTPPVPPPPPPPAARPLPATPALDVPVGQTRSGLVRRVPGAQLQAGLASHDPTPHRRSQDPTTHRTAQSPTPPQAPVHDAAAARDALDAYQSAIARAATPAPASPPRPVPVSPAPPPASPAPVPAPPVPAPPVSAAPTNGGPANRSSLARRIPGAHLAASLRRDEPAATPARDGDATAARNPELDRAVFDAYAAGLARAEAETTP